VYGERSGANQPRQADMLPILIAVLLALAAPAAPQPPAPPAPGSPSNPRQPPADLDELRGQLLAGINGVRRAAGAPEVAELAALDRVAAERAAEVGARGAMPDEAESMALFGRIQRRMVAAGYLPHLWTESMAAAPGDAAAVIDWWRQSADLPQAMRREFRDVGIGVARYQGVPLYVFLFAWPEADSWRRDSEPLRDLASVRIALLAAVNAARHAAGAPPLAGDARLDAAAQAHAEDMLARSYYAHESPEGGTPRARVEAAGFPAGMVAENIAARHLGAGEAVAGWMSSSAHRRNLLDPRFTHLGAGVAVGSFEHRYQILWVLDLARPR
jgi:uncharacterized protein YkwD